LLQCGFGKVSASYASMHLQVETPVIAAKALGAILLGLGLPISTPMPNIKLLRQLIP
jgi:acetylornithine/succinyldiaminopimelate/putrescine aminotransferase